MSLFDRLGFERQPKPAINPDWMITEVLPESVRYDLKYKAGQTGSAGVRELMVPARKMQRLGLYAALKAADGRPELQLPILERLVELNFDISQLKVEDFGQVLDDMDGRQSTVDIKKLAEVSRKGFDNWPSQFGEQLAEKVSPDASIFALAYSAVMGIDKLAQARSGDRALHILIPNSFDDASLPSVGYVIHSTGSIDLLPRDFARPASAVVIDDIENTGSTRRQVADFWGPSNLDYVPLLGRNTIDAQRKW